jgi:hypothetical protein
VSISKGTPRAAEDQQQEVVGLFRTYDAGASFTNQEAAPVKMTLAFTEEHVKIYDVASAQVATSMAKLTGDKLVKQIVALCACEIKFCTVETCLGIRFQLLGNLLLPIKDQNLRPSPRRAAHHRNQSSRKHHHRNQSSRKYHPKRKHFLQAVKKMTTVTRE